MDEDVEAEKIRLLEERMRLFDNKATPIPVARQDHDMASSDESSSDSGSESE